MCENQLANSFQNITWTPKQFYLAAKYICDETNAIRSTKLPEDTVMNYSPERIRPLIPARSATSITPSWL